MLKKGDALTPMNYEDRIPSYKKNTISEFLHTKKKYNNKETSGASKENTN